MMIFKDQSGSIQAMQTLGVITARGGSKSVPRKNIKDCAGQPLIGYTIQAIKESELLTRCIVSTEDEEIATVSKALGGDVPFLRPAELATDSTKSIDVVVNVLQKLAAQGETYDYVMILQPTSPLRTAADIDACIRLADETKADSVMSIVSLEDLTLTKIKRIINGRIVPALGEEGGTRPRQEQEVLYRRNCAIYLTKTSVVENGSLVGNDSRAYIMPADRSIDINTPTDFAFAEFLLERNRHENR